MYARKVFVNFNFNLIIRYFFFGFLEKKKIKYFIKPHECVFTLKGIQFCYLNIRYWYFCIHRSKIWFQILIILRLFLTTRQELYMLCWYHGELWRCILLFWKYIISIANLFHSYRVLFHVFKAVIGPFFMFPVKQK